MPMCCSWRIQGKLRRAWRRLWTTSSRTNEFCSPLDRKVDGRITNYIYLKKPVSERLGSDRGRLRRMSRASRSSVRFASVYKRGDERKIYLFVVKLHAGASRFRTLKTQCKGSK